MQSMFTIGLVGCGSPAASDAPVDGEFKLVAFGGVPVPVWLDEMPTRSGQPSGCYFTLSDGELAMDGSRGAFVYDVRYRDSCTGALLSSTSADGSYTASGAVLTFRITGANGTITFGGTVASDTVIIRRNPDYIYYFKRKG